MMENTPQTPASLQALPNISVSLPGISQRNSSVSHLVVFRPCVLYSGNTMSSQPGYPAFVAWRVLTISSICLSMSALELTIGAGNCIAATRRPLLGLFILPMLPIIKPPEIVGRHFPRSQKCMMQMLSPCIYKDIIFIVNYSFSPLLIRYDSQTGSTNILPSPL